MLPVEEASRIINVSTDRIYIVVCTPVLIKISMLHTYEQLFREYNDDEIKNGSKWIGVGNIYRIYVIIIVRNG